MIMIIYCKAHGLGHPTRKKINSPHLRKFSLFVLKGREWGFVLLGGKWGQIHIQKTT